MWKSFIVGKKYDNSITGWKCKYSSGSESSTGQTSRGAAPQHILVQTSHFAYHLGSESSSARPISNKAALPVVRIHAPLSDPAIHFNQEFGTKCTDAIKYIVNFVDLTLL